MRSDTQKTQEYQQLPRRFLSTANPRLCQSRETQNQYLALEVRDPASARSTILAHRSVARAGYLSGPTPPVSSAGPDHLILSRLAPESSNNLDQVLLDVLAGLLLPLEPVRHAASP